MSRPFGVARLVLLAVTAFGSGCEDQGKPFACRCPFLTDHDDSSAQAVEVCAKSAELAAEVARGCAQSAAPAPVQSCSCEASPTAATQPCAVGHCQVREHKP